MCTTVNNYYYGNMELESGSDQSELSLSEAPTIDIRHDICAPTQTEGEQQAVDIERELEAGQELWDGDTDGKRLTQKCFTV